MFFSDLNFEKFCGNHLLQSLLSVSSAVYRDAYYNTYARHIQTQSNTQADTNTQVTPLLAYERIYLFINFWLRFFDTRRETILKSLS